MTNTPLISVVIPTYNRANTLPSCLKSVIDQDYQHWECLVVDDFSTDFTKDLVNEWSNRDSRIKYILNKRSKGAQGARNTGVIESNGDWICFLDSDDCLSHSSISNRVLITQESLITNLALVYGDKAEYKFNFIRGNAKNWMIKNMALCPYSVMLVNKKLAFDDYNLDERFPAWQDDDFVFDLALKYNVYHCGEIIAYHCDVKPSFTITQSSKNLRNGLALMIKKRKFILLKECGLAHLFYWYMRLLKLNLDVRIENQKNRSIQILLKKLHKLIKRFLKEKFDFINA